MYGAGRKGHRLATEGLLKHLAEQWLKMAVELERAHALRDELESKAKKAASVRGLFQDS
jgi:hypothetical protein